MDFGGDFTIALFDLCEKIDEMSIRNTRRYNSMSYKGLNISVSKKSHLLVSNKEFSQKLMMDPFFLNVFCSHCMRRARKQTQCSSSSVGVREEKEDEKILLSFGGFHRIVGHPRTHYQRPKHA